MPETGSQRSKKGSLSRLLTVLVVLVVAFFVLRFVVAIAWTVMKWVGIGMLALFLVYLFLGGDKGERAG